MMDKVVVVVATWLVSKRERLSMINKNLPGTCEVTDTWTKQKVHLRNLTWNPNMKVLEDVFPVQNG